MVAIAAACRDGRIPARCGRGNRRYTRRPAASHARGSWASTRAVVDRRRFLQRRHGRTARRSRPRSAAAIDAQRRGLRDPRRLHARAVRGLRDALRGAHAQHPPLAAAAAQGPRYPRARAGRRRRASTAPACISSPRNWMAARCSHRPWCRSCPATTLPAFQAGFMLREHKLYPMVIEWLTSGRLQWNNGQSAALDGTTLDCAGGAAMKAHQASLMRWLVALLLACSAARVHAQPRPNCSPSPPPIPSTARASPPATADVQLEKMGEGRWSYQTAHSTPVSSPVPSSAAKMPAEPQRSVFRIQDSRVVPLQPHRRRRAATHKDQLLVFDWAARPRHRRRSNASPWICPDAAGPARCAIRCRWR